MGHPVGKNNHINKDHIDLTFLSKSSPNPFGGKQKPQLSDDLVL